jgi:hypothetical protein
MKTRLMAVMLPLMIGCGRPAPVARDMNESVYVVAQECIDSGQDCPPDFMQIQPLKAVLYGQWMAEPWDQPSSSAIGIIVAPTGDSSCHVYHTDRDLDSVRCGDKEWDCTNKNERDYFCTRATP